MARGGRRPGAGAPRGNFNAVRSGNHSARMMLVYLRLIAEPDTLGLARDMYDAGLFPPPRHEVHRKDVPRVVDFLWRRWFDRPGPGQSNPIKDNLSEAVAQVSGTMPQIRNEPSFLHKERLRRNSAGNK